METKDTKKNPRSEKSRSLVKKLGLTAPRFLEDDMSDKVKEKINDAKKKHRTGTNLNKFLRFIVCLQISNLRTGTEGISRTRNGVKSCWKNVPIK